MTDFQNPIDAVAMEKTKEAFLTRGFSAEEFAQQMKKLGELILQKALLNLLKTKPPAQSFSTEEDAINYVQKNFSPEEIENTLLKESAAITRDYLAAVGIASF